VEEGKGEEVEADAKYAKVRVGANTSDGTPAQPIRSPLHKSYRLRPQQ